MTTTVRDPITCHVLDTTTGRPAPNITVKLICTVQPEIVFEGKTNADGRIANWENTQEPGDGETTTYVQLRGGVHSALNFMIAHNTRSVHSDVSTSVWKLQFDTGAYYGLENTFFPVVELTFLVEEGEHYHVPLLLGPYSFTTYRGS